MSQEEIVQFSQEEEMTHEIEKFMAVSSNEVKLTSKGSSQFINVDSNCEWTYTAPSTDLITVEQEWDGIKVISNTNDEFDGVEIVINGCDEFSETITVSQTKYIYIKHDVRGFYVTLYSVLDENLYNNIGETWGDFNANKWVLLSDEQVEFKANNPTAKIHEVFKMEFEPIHVRNLTDAKNEMLRKIEEYDQSSNVNGFTVNGAIEAWFTPSERSNYKSSIDAANLLGIETLSFYVGDTLLTVTPTIAEQLLAQIQLYADQCFIVTKQHKAIVESLETIEEVDAYDYTANYPTKMNFNLE